jgi:hypothetical protein
MDTSSSIVRKTWQDTSTILIRELIGLLVDTAGELLQLRSTRTSWMLTLHGGKIVHKLDSQR